VPLVASFEDMTSHQVARETLQRMPDESLPERERWAAQRYDIERSRHWAGPDGRRNRRYRQLFNGLLTTLAIGIRLAPLLYRRGRQNALNLRLVEFQVPLPELPLEFDGYRILHVSDPHLDVLPELADASRELLQGLEVDLLALTGDVHGHHRALLSHSADLLARALGGVRVRGHRLAVLGNHDPIAMVAALERIGFEVLINSSVILERGSGRVRITGLDDVHYFYTEAARDALNSHDGECRIALVHSPEMADHADEAGYALYLCGHTHGGQICLPGGRPLVTQLTRCKHASRGWWRQGSLKGYTSCGLGVSGPPVRFHTRGEVGLITLRRSLATE